MSEGERASDAVGAAQVGNMKKQLVYRCSWGFGILVLVAFLLSVCQLMTRPVPAAFVSYRFSDACIPCASGPVYREGVAHPDGITRSVHASTLAVLTNGNVLAAWYGGSREGAGDVAIYMATYNSHTKTWGETRRVVDAVQTGGETGRPIRKLGNPVLVSDSQGTVRLFYVSVSVGGWSFSSINRIQSDDGGRSWSPARRMITSPFLNLGTLVKGAPLFFSDGSIALPVYAEFMGKFGELLRIDRCGRVMDKNRISHGRRSIQPVIVPRDPQHAVALLRNCGEGDRRVLRTVTADGGVSWGALESLDLPNPDAALAAVRIDRQRLLLVFNNTSRGRHNLSIAVSQDGGSQWRVIHVLEDAPSRRGRFSYPFLVACSI